MSRHHRRQQHLLHPATSAQARSTPTFVGVTGTAHVTASWNHRRRAPAALRHRVGVHRSLGRNNLVRCGVRSFITNRISSPCSAKLISSIPPRHRRTWTAFRNDVGWWIDRRPLPPDHDGPAAYYRVMDLSPSSFAHPAGRCEVVEGRPRISERRDSPPRRGQGVEKPSSGSVRCPPLTADAAELTKGR
jgi:hypothetical protein